jgi:HK97 gp10 family phage protein
VASLILDDGALDELFNAKDGPVGQLLEKIGADGVAIAQSLAPVSTGEGESVIGELRNSITYVVEDDQDGLAVVIGSDVRYSAYVEFGTFDTPAQPFLRPMLAVVKP